jgi:hypothetical protein
MGDPRQPLGGLPPALWEALLVSAFQQIRVDGYETGKPVLLRDFYGLLESHIVVVGVEPPAMKWLLIVPLGFIAIILLFVHPLLGLLAIGLVGAGWLGYHHLQLARARNELWAAEIRSRMEHHEKAADGRERAAEALDQFNARNLAREEREERDRRLAEIRRGSGK